MKYCCGYVYVFVCIIAAIFVSAFPVMAQESMTDFLSMEGTKITHAYNDHEDPSPRQKIIELRKENGLPIWFAKDVHKAVCSTGSCQKISLWIFWDEIGNYLGFQLYNNEPLTKVDHVEFDMQDYERLHQILSDTSSVLKYMSQEDLIHGRSEEEQMIDGVSGATQLALREYLVPDAAYTCHTLWHTVYGPIQKEVYKILDQKGDEAYLRLLFDQGNDKEKSWAIGFIQRRPMYHSIFYPHIIELVKGGNDALSLQALNYFKLDLLTDLKIQNQLISSINEFPKLCQFELLWNLEELVPVSDKSILILLEKFSHKKLEVSLLTYIYDLISEENVENPLIQKHLESYLDHDNLYVRNATKRLLGRHRIN